MRRLLIFISILTIILQAPLSAQETLKTLKTNDVLRVKAKLESQAGIRSIGDSRDTLCLPFLDDFSNPRVFVDSLNSLCPDTVYNTPSEIYPKALYWLDKGAFVNQTYPDLPPTYGVATLDGLDSKGRPYNSVLPYGSSDTLTSKPIYLEDPVDTVYLSFYHQAGGLGDYPNQQDSLVLEFLNKDSIWRNIWSTTDLNGSDFSPFTLEMIPVDTSFHHDAFQFRFRSYATRSGNNDHWHIDYIFLNDDRSFDDTLFRDVSFIQPPTSILENYTFMPWNQFKDFQSQELASTHSFTMRNNFNTIINTTYQYQAFNGDDVVLPLTPEIAINFDPFSVFTADFSTFEIPTSLPNYNDDSLSLTLQYILDPGGDINRTNDTLLFQQDFYNYYAYDDGSAEKAYGLVGTNAKLAMRYHTNQPDTLRAVFVHWALVDQDLSSKFFSLTVWEDIDTTGASGDETIIYQEDFLNPTYVDSINGFFVYFLDSLVVVDGDFYVGWRQSQSSLLNIGFDVNNDASSNTYFKIGGDWQQSVLTGAIMFRPLVGNSYFKYTANSIWEIPESLPLDIHPNPAANFVIVDLDPRVFNAIAEVFDYTGKLVSKTSLNGNNILDIGILSSGMYIVRVEDKQNDLIYSGKFIKQ